jgi:hypothetical protein
MNVMGKCAEIFRKPENQADYQACLNCICAIIADINSAKDNNLLAIWNFLGSLPKYEVSKLKEYKDVIFFFNVLACFYGVSIDTKTLNQTRMIQKAKSADYSSDLKTLLFLHNRTAHIWRMVEKPHDKKIIESVIETIFEMDTKKDIILRTYRLKHFYENFDLKTRAIK